ncbi:aspartate kinase [Candidatus Magnetoovum chiemensis]|nr:aspartate kinase [Candidatus Magnetoovum chiemensis]
MLIVQKYGGTSVGSIERIKNVAQRAVNCAKENNSVVLVVSAMAGETDGLIKKALEVNENPIEREIDLLLSSGERISAALTALAISSYGYKSVSLTGRQAGIYTDCMHTKARISKIESDRVKEYLDEGYIPVIAGFQGVTENCSDVTTLGRGGSDLTAVAIAGALGADLCEIYTDVDGVFTTDPAVVRNARKLKKISYDEMLELASMGAKVLQTRSVEFAKKYNVPVVVRNSFNNEEGTLVTKEDKDMEDIAVSGIAYDKNQVKITLVGVPDKPGIAARIFEALAIKGIVVDMIVQNISVDNNYTDISYTVPANESKTAVSIAKDISQQLGAKGINIDEDVSKVSVVGVGMRAHCGIAAKMFKTLSDNNINIMMISTSEIKISVIIAAKYTELAVRQLHEAFELEKN